MPADDNQRKYKYKLRQLKRLIRQVVFENAALCDECVTVSKKLDKVGRWWKKLVGFVMLWQQKVILGGSSGAC